MDYLITTDKHRIDVGAVHAMLSTTYWSPRIKREVVEVAIRNSLVAAAIHQPSGELVGIARVVTDYATFAWLCDVFVIEGHRGRGLAKRMIVELQGHSGVQTLRRWCLATRDAHALYKQLGYEPVPPGAWMEKKMPVSQWQEPEPAGG
ncbi:MAG: GNAT family N-acetyltransferase [Phycisphaerales bacterium]|nr:GNAT family N-acetyltransferase [Phycisphaerales bacterium]